jgi:hypothetical protein
LTLRKEIEQGKSEPGRVGPEEPGATVDVEDLSLEVIFVEMHNG